MIVEDFEEDFNDAGMTPGTSVASQFFRSALPQAIESTWAPTLMNPLATSGVLGGVGLFAGLKQ